MSPLCPAWLCLLATVTLFSESHAASSKTLLTKVKTLTLRRDKLTTGRRSEPIPQLQCTGGSARGLFEVDTMRCTNQGTDYDDLNVQWTCTASLPPEFKLGSTDVLCEGYDSPDDPYVLKGSCGVEYRLVLTEAGEVKYGATSKRWYQTATDKPSSPASVSGWSGKLVFLVFAGVASVIVYNFVRALLNRRPVPRQRRRLPRGRDTGGTGWSNNPHDDSSDDDDPPPPYDFHGSNDFADFNGSKPAPKPRSRTTAASSSRATAQPSNSWRPGFWTGLAGGAASTYLAGRLAQQAGGSSSSTSRGARDRPEMMDERRYGQGGGSGMRGSSSLSSSSSTFAAPSTERYSSSGFGETRRR